MSSQTYAQQLWNLVPSKQDAVDLANSTKEAAADRLRDAVGQAADAGNSAVQGALDLGGAAVDRGQDAVEGAKDQGQDIFDRIAESVVGSDDQELQTETETVVDLPGQTEEEPVEEAVKEAIEVATGPTYKDQRDNKSSHVGGDASCSPTSFTAALIDSVGDEASIRTQVVSLIDERGGNSGYEQTEELVIELLQVVNWASVCKSNPSFFWNGADWASWAKSTYGGAYYKDPYAQQYVASLFDGMSSSTGEVLGSLDGVDDFAPVIEALNGGAEVTAEGGDMTSSGHVIRILEADASGMTINDPYGLWVHKGLYYKNGSETIIDAGADTPTLERRASKNSALLGQYDAFAEQGADWAPYARWGEQNWYSWADVSSAGIGKWVSILNKG
ncbi:MAG: hypothetical protein ACI9MC_002575 [Kiritimatiellia bacterium]|jgi:hypothetical protein